MKSFKKTESGITAIELIFTIAVIILAVFVIYLISQNVGKGNENVKNFQKAIGIYNYLNDYSIGDWNFNDGSGKDKSGYVNNATFENGAYLSDVSAISEEYVFLDGINDYLKIEKFNISNITELTVTGWVKIRDNDNQWMLISQNSQTGDCFRLFYDLERPYSSIKLKTCDSDLGSMTCALDQETFNNDLWHFIVFTFDGFEKRILVDGKEICMTAQGPINFSSNSGSLMIGAEIDSGNSYNLSGSIDEIRIYDKGLSSEQINKIYGNKH